MTDPIQRRVFRAWLEDWEKPLLKNNDPVAEARLRVKYQGLLFLTLIIKLFIQCTLEIWSIAKDGMVGGV